MFDECGWWEGGGLSLVCGMSGVWWWLVRRCSLTSCGRSGRASQTTAAPPTATSRARSGGKSSAPSCRHGRRIWRHAISNDITDATSRGLFCMLRVCHGGKGTLSAAGSVRDVSTVCGVWSVVPPYIVVYVILVLWFRCYNTILMQ